MLERHNFSSEREAELYTRVMQRADNALPLLPTFDLSAMESWVKREHPEWSAERLHNAIADYRTFFAMVKQNPNAETHIILTDVDAVWHCHLLLDRKYEKDCQDYLGFRLYHENVKTVEMCAHPKWCVADQDTL